MPLAVTTEATTLIDPMSSPTTADADQREHADGTPERGWTGDAAPQGRRRPGSSILPRRFALHRVHDVSGVSGEGVVAFGTVYGTGRTTLAWCAGDIASVTVYDSPEQVVRVHGHGGSTRLVWIDRPGRDQLVEEIAR